MTKGEIYYFSELIEAGRRVPNPVNPLNARQC